MRRLFGVKCDRPECDRVVAIVEPHCCYRCEMGGDHTESCNQRQEAWREADGRQS